MRDGQTNNGGYFPMWHTIVTVLQTCIIFRVCNVYHVLISHSSSDKPGRVWDHYQVSPKMSPYLVAFIVAHSDFMPTDNTMIKYLNKSSPEFRIYARKQLLNTAEYASSIGPRVLEYYGDYFGIPYPLPHLLMAAIPDFAAGAMENWGLLSYRWVLMSYVPCIMFYITTY